MLVEISCPACNEGTIKLNPELLLLGLSFACDHCGASAAVADESKTTLQKGLSEFHKLKRSVGDARADGAQAS